MLHVDCLVDVALVIVDITIVDIIVAMSSRVTKSLLGCLIEDDLPVVTRSPATISVVWM